MATASRRHVWCHALACVAALALPRAFAATIRSEERSVAGFDAVEWDALGELVIEQGSGEHLRIRAEPQVLPKILTEVRQGRLSIRLAPGRLRTQLPIRIELGVKALRLLRTAGSGTVRVGTLSGETLELDLAAAGDVAVAALDVRRLDVHMGGSGDVTIARGRAETQQIAIPGSGRYLAARLTSRRARVSIEGSGSAELAVADTLDCEIAGSGEIGYRGSPVLRQNITGAGRVLPRGP
jgi:hypothetical protein